MRIPGFPLVVKAVKVTPIVLAIIYRTACIPIMDQILLI